MTVDVRSIMIRNGKPWRKQQYKLQSNDALSLLTDCEMSVRELRAFVPVWWDTLRSHYTTNTRKILDGKNGEIIRQKVLPSASITIREGEEVGGISLENTQHRIAIRRFASSTEIELNHAERYNFGTCLFLAARGNPHAMRSWHAMDFLPPSDADTVIYNDCKSVTFFLRSNAVSALVLLEHPNVLRTMMACGDRWGASINYMRFAFKVLDELYTERALFHEALSVFLTCEKHFTVRLIDHIAREVVSTPMGTNPFPLAMMALSAQANTLMRSL